MKISAVLFAGGESRRFGRDKALFPWNGSPLWEHQLTTLRRTDPGEIIVSARTDPPWRPAETRFVADAQPACGPLGGLLSALKIMKGSHLLALAIDMPFMTSDYLRALGAEVAPDCGVVPMLDGKPEPLAAIYPGSAASPIADVIAQGLDLSLRSLITALLQSRQMRPLNISPNESQLFQNINQPKDVPRQPQTP